MERISLGKNQDGNTVALDLDQEKIRFLLLAGVTGSGKSVFHQFLYKVLSQKYSPEELGFIFLDVPRSIFNVLPPDYLIRPVIYDSQEAIEALFELAKLKSGKKIFIHIEESDIVYVDRTRVEKALFQLKNLPNFYVVYSTSRIDRTYLRDWMKHFIDLKVIFRVATKDDSMFLLNNDSASRFLRPGERILCFNNHQITCMPFEKGHMEIPGTHHLIPKIHARGGSRAAAEQCFETQDTNKEKERLAQLQALAQEGVSLYNICKWLGHADFKTTQIYAHFTPVYDDDIEKLSIESSTAVGT